MTIKEIIDTYGDPTKIWDNALNRSANKNSYYLYEIHNMSFDFWENQVWIFNTLEQFREFTVALELFDFIYNQEKEDYDFEEYDYSENIENLKKIKAKENWTFDDCLAYVNNYNHSELQLNGFGKVIDLLNTTETDFENSKQLLFSFDDLKEYNLSEAQYKILHKYQNVTNILPGKSEEQFLNFLSEWSL